MPELDNAVLAYLQSMDKKIDSNFNLLVGGQKTLFEKFSAHEAEDQRRFEEIHVKAAEADGVAKATAKLWGIGGGIVSTLLIGGWETIKHFWK